MSESDKVLYERLRLWRKETAEKEGIPPYLICTNSHLKEIVMRRCRSIEAMKIIKGLGKSKLEKNGKAILSIIEDFYGKNRN